VIVSEIARLLQFQSNYLFFQQLCQQFSLENKFNRISKIGRILKIKFIWFLMKTE